MHQSRTAIVAQAVTANEPMMARVRLLPASRTGKMRGCSDCRPCVPLLSGLILLGFAFVALPCCSACSAQPSRCAISRGQRALVLNGVAATQYTQALVRQVASLERTVRLYQIIQRPRCSRPSTRTATCWSRRSTASVACRRPEREK